MSVIVPVHGETDRFEKTLRALHEQSYPRNRWEVIVIDNGAFSALDKVVTKLPNAILLKEVQTGSYCARNTGLQYARGTIIAFTDSDCIPHRNWIENGVKALQKSTHIGLVAGRIDVFFASLDQPASTEVYDSLVSFPQKLTLERYNYGATANLFTTRNVIQKVGIFNYSRLSGGDCEWGQRVRASGFRQEYCESAVIQHPARKSFSALIRKSRRVTIGTMHTLAHNDGKTLSLSCWYYHLIRRPVYLWSEMSEYYSHLGFAMRFRVLGIYYIVKLVQLAERVRVAVFGGQPQR